LTIPGASDNFFNGLKFYGMNWGKMELTGIILAGGKNTRIGEDKSFIKVGNRTIIERIVSTLSAIFHDIIIISNSPESYSSLNCKISPDIVQDKDSLGGIYTGLRVSSTDYNFFFACDMPFLNENLIKFMIHSIEDADIVIPRTSRGCEPLHAIYSKKCIPYIKKQIEKNNLRIIDFFPSVRVKEIEQRDIEKYGSLHTAFLNLNTRQDLLKAQEIEKLLLREQKA
jgi:molybdopterin-guanine dinucleotide biosynthesis protein A